MRCRSHPQFGSTECGFKCRAGSLNRLCWRKRSHCLWSSTALRRRPLHQCWMTITASSPAGQMRWTGALPLCFCCKVCVWTCSPQCFDMTARPLMRWHHCDLKPVWVMHKLSPIIGGLPRVHTATRVPRRRARAAEAVHRSSRPFTSAAPHSQVHSSTCVTMRARGSPIACCSNSGAGVVHRTHRHPTPRPSLRLAHVRA